MSFSFSPAFCVLPLLQVVREYERALIFRLGRIQGGARGPGLFSKLPIVDKILVVDLRTRSLNVTPQKVRSWLRLGEVLV